MATTPQFAASDLAGTFPRGEAPGLFEVCERRLVLSAQLLFDVLGDHALELHGDSSSSPPGELVPIDSHLREAHAASGWSTVQQQFGLTGKGQTVAVIDSGIAWDHVALGQGYGPGYRVVGGWDFTEENDAQPYDDGPLGFHGTHVSGIIGSSDAVHTGVAPDVDLVALRVFNDIGQGQLSWVERALQWVHDNRNRFENPITTVNLSLGTSWNSNELPAWATLEEELRTLYQDGIVVTASAGNSFQSYQTPGLSYPAASQYVLPVASVDDDGQLSNFSQRNDRVLAAPGSNIVSTVPDHVLGRDGKIDDFTAASGTSMAAPYVAGASVLVRQAMEMVDYAGINASSIADHLHATADSVYDALTGSSYDRLNLQQAIDTLLPDDLVGDSPASVAPLDLGAPRLEGWINTLGDQDVYRFTAAASGSLHLDAGSEWLDTLQWSLQSAGQQIQSGGLEPAAVQLIAGQTYELLVSANREIGSFSFDLDFQLAGGGQGTGESVPPGDNPINLGPVAYKEQTLAAGSQLRVQAVHDGIFTVQWTAPDQPAGAMSVSSSAGDEARDATWSHGALRIDLPVVAGQWLDIRLPDSGGGSGELALAGVLSQLGSTLQVQGTMNGDELAVSLQDGLQLRFGKIEYAYPAGAISHLQIEAQGSNDRLHLLGSPQSDQVELRPGGATLVHDGFELVVNSVEQIAYDSGGGPDRVYLYDSDGDDTLTARPRSAELVGVGYRFEVTEVSRIYVHATGGGQDYAYLYDSQGDDRLSVRPQFSSLSGDGYFNYVRGFERVYAYATGGGQDRADLYDSSGDDRFATSGASASVVGPGFSSFTRSFESVYAHSSGGSDLATLYGASAQTQWQQGSDFIRFREGDLSREARGFQSVETFVAGQPQRLGESLASLGEGQAPLLSTANTSPWLTPVGWASQDVERPLAEEPAVAQPLHGPAAHPNLAELGVLRQTDELSAWLQTRLALPEEPLLNDPLLEHSLLDEIFGQL